jgi:hypothetical protein
MPGLLLLPYLFLIALLHGNHRKVLMNRYIYICAFLTIAACAAYYGLREANYPGYWQLVKKSEFNRFSGKGIEWHVQAFDFYLQNFVAQKRYFVLIYLLPVTFATFYAAGRLQTKRIFLYLWIIIAGYFLFISIPPVKLEWYDAPLYPLFALVFGIFVHEICSKWIRKPGYAPYLIVASSAIVCWPHYRHILEKTRFIPEKVVDFEREGLVMRQLAQAKPAETTYTVLVETKKEVHLDQVKFYQRSFEQERGAKIGFKDRVWGLRASEKVLFAQERWADSVRVHFPAALVLFESAQGKLLELKR